MVGKSKLMRWAKFNFLEILYVCLCFTHVYMAKWIFMKFGFEIVKILRIIMVYVRSWLDPTFVLYNLTKTQKVVTIWMKFVNINKTY